jgi:citrate lyase beta subunit
MESSLRARRALLYIPGDDMRKIRKGINLDVDCVCMDMEDGVAINRKNEARMTIAEALSTLDFGRSERLVRINPVGSGLETEDLKVALSGHPDGIVIPKVETSAQLGWVSQEIDKFYETRYGAGDTNRKRPHLIAIVETARGIINLAEIAQADPGLQALIFGAEDLAGDIGAIRTREGKEIFYARSALMLHAAANNLQAIDMVFVDFKDEHGLMVEARQGAEMGFAGKQIIHPNQVEPVQAAFTPGDDEIEQAQRILAAYRRHQEAGQGAFAMDGKMVDAPIVKAAERVMARVRAAGRAAPE